jgi:hypothetical protein
METLGIISRGFFVSWIHSGTDLVQVKNVWLVTLQDSSQTLCPSSEHNDHCPVKNNLKNIINKFV